MRTRSGPRRQFTIDMEKAHAKVEVVTDTAVWYHTGKPPVPIRWVLIRDPQANFRPQALLSTDLDHTCEQIVAWFVQRWTSGSDV